MSFFNSIFNILRFNKKNWKAVVLCIFTATVFWFFNALNKEYTTTISFPLEFDFNRDRYIPVKPLPQDVRINVTGIGWNLFRRSARVKVPPLVIPLDKPTDVRKIVGSTLPVFFANQLSDFQINFVITDTLMLAIEPKARRKVSLELYDPGSLFQTGYALISPIHIIPDSIIIEGPERSVLSLEEPVNLRLSQRNIDGNFTETVSVEIPDGSLIKRDPPAVEVSFQVDKLIEVTDSVMLELINVPDQTRPFIQSKKMPIKIAVPQSMLNFYDADSVKAVVDLSNFTRGSIKVRPVVKGLPPFSQIISLDSVFIKR
jgi:hypothetical protein